MVPTHQYTINHHIILPQNPTGNKWLVTSHIYNLGVASQQNISPSGPQITSKYMRSEDMMERKRSCWPSTFFPFHLADSARLYRQFSGKELAHADPHLISSDRIWIGHCKKFCHQAFYILILVIDKQPGLARQIIIFSLEWPLNILICIEFVRLKNDFFQIIFTPLPEVRCSC